MLSVILTYWLAGSGKQVRIFEAVVLKILTSVRLPLVLTPLKLGKVDSRYCKCDPVFCVNATTLPRLDWCSGSRIKSLHKQQLCRDTAMSCPYARIDTSFLIP